MAYTRTESIMATTKHHPSRCHGKARATRDGKIVAMDFRADFNTGVYAS
jgi:CO/xanthine dehydrogenase Mo-binding subunit